MPLSRKDRCERAKAAGKQWVPSCAPSRSLACRKIKADYLDQGLAIPKRLAGACRRTTKRGAPTGGVVRRPGMPIDPCIATRTDLELMTVAQIKRFANEYGIPLPERSPYTGRTPVKGDLIDAVTHHMGLQCEVPAFADPSTASMHDLGIYARHKNIPLPKHSAKQVKGKAALYGPSESRSVARADLAAAIKKATAAVAVAPPAVITAVQTPVVQQQQQKQPQAAQAKKEPTVQAELKVPPGPVVGVVQPFEPSAPPMPIEGTVQEKFNPFTYAKELKFDFRTPGKKDYFRGAEQAFNTATDGQLSFVVDKACMLDDGSDFGEIVSNPTRGGGVLWKNCTTTAEGTDCDKSVIYVEPLTDKKAQDSWTARTKMYMAFAKFGGGEYIHMPVLPFKAAWTCGGAEDAEIEYVKTKAGFFYGQKPTIVKSAKGMLGFVVATAPSDHTLLTVGDYVKMHVGTDWDIMETVDFLIGKIVASGYGPNKLDLEDIIFSTYTDDSVHISGYLAPLIRGDVVPVTAEYYKQDRETIKNLLEAWLAREREASE